jgi:glutathione peroxidase
MDKYKGKVVLVVNLASACGFTPQYAELQELYQRYSSKGLVVLGFPVSGTDWPGGFGAAASGVCSSQRRSFCMWSSQQFLHCCFVRWPA